MTNLKSGINGLKKLNRPKKAAMFLDGMTAFQVRDLSTPA